MAQTILSLQYLNISIKTRWHIITNRFKTFWFNIPDKIRFLFIGGFNFVVSYVIYSALLYWILGAYHYQIALILSWIISSVISFTTQRIFVFPIDGNLIKQYFKCCTTWIFSYIINAILLEMFVRYLHFNPYVAQIFATSGCAVFTYIMFKCFAFRKEK